MDVSKIMPEPALEEQMDFDPFEEQGAWRNSEIAQILIAQAEFEELMVETPTNSTQTPETPTTTLLPASPLPHTTTSISHESVVAELDLWAAEQELRKLASTAAMAGDVKAAYLIERAIEELVEAKSDAGDGTE